MKVVLLGVRGSTAAPGAAFVRYGGHTSCVAVLADDEDRPRLVLDAGTGLRSLPALLDGGPFDGDIVLTHLHWDHYQGLPFCPAVDRDDARVDLHVPVSATATDPIDVLTRGFSPPHFPITPWGLKGEWTFRPMHAGPVPVRSAAVVTAAPVSHKGGLTLGLRVELDGVSVAYLPDHALHSATSAPDVETAGALVAGADLVLHDGQFVAAEDAVARDYGHATLEAVLAFADRYDVGAVAFTHHGPPRTDDELDALAAQYTTTPAGRPVSFAVQDQVIVVPGPTPVRGS